MNKTIFTRRNVIAGAVLITVTIILAAGLAAAQADKGRFDKGWNSKHKGWNSENMAEHISDRITSELDLSAEQETRVEEIIRASQGKMSKWREDTQARITSSITADELSPEEAAKLLELPEQTIDELRVSLAETLAQIHSVLTPEQRQEAADLFADSRLSAMASGAMFGRGLLGHGRGHHGDRDRHGRGHHGDRDRDDR